MSLRAGLVGAWEGALTEELEPPGMAWEPAPGDYVRPVGLVKAAALNGVLGEVQERSRWGEGTVAVLLNTTPPKGMQFKPKNLEEETEEPPLCTVCLEGVPSPIQMGCGCRGDQGLAHVKCRAEVAKAEREV